jgi:hypothetical protein
VGVAGEQAVAMSLMYYALRVVAGLIGGLMYLIGNLRATQPPAVQSYPNLNEGPRVADRDSSAAVPEALPERQSPAGHSSE